MTPDAAQKSIDQALRNPQMMAAAKALRDGRLHDAEPALRERLKQNPFDVVAIRMMAELAGRIGRFKDAENLLRRAIELAPGWIPARSNLAMALYRQNKHIEAVEILQDISKEDDSPANNNLMAAALGRIGDYAEALDLYAEVLDRYPGNPKVWMSYGHVLKTVGRQDECIAAYRKALELRPELGEIWWSLANLKTVRFSDADVAVMQTALKRTDISDEDRYHLDFALGKAKEDARDHETSMAHYLAGNSLRQKSQPYDASDTTRHVERSIALFTTEFFAAHKDYGSDRPDPVFILGMPRAGSTLIEQILSSHPMVEGTHELPNIGGLARRIGASDADHKDGYLPLLAQLDGEALRHHGEDYIEQTRVYRKTEKPLFIDKMPNNWRHIGLIHLVLPNAIIIDARRHPLDCGFSNFKQHFARGQGFSYDLADIGLYYRDYVRLMQAIDGALPGRVHRVIHEALVDDPEREVGALLDHMGLPFDERCLRFWENDRAVQTASSEQVRRPINRDGVDQWKAFDPWLDPLKKALGPVWESYPDAPDFAAFR